MDTPGEKVRVQFVGKARRAHLDRVHKTIRTSRRERLPQTHVILGPTGFGKTRLIQEVFAGLDREGPSQYWPSRIEAGSEGPLENRKSLVPMEWDVEAKASLGWLWLGVAGDRSLTSSRGFSIADDLKSQMHAHSPALEISLNPRGAAALRSYVRAGVAGLADLGEGSASLVDSGLELGLGSVLEASSVARGLYKSGKGFARVRRRRAEGFSERQVRQIRPPRLHGELAGQIASISKEIPVILVIDDVHLVDVGFAETAAELMRRGEMLTIVASAWPDMWESSALHESFSRLPENARKRIHVESLAGLEMEALIELARSQLPTTPTARLKTLAANYPNPLALFEFLRLPRVQTSVVDGSLQMTADEIASSPRSLQGLFEERWQSMPLRTRKIAALAAWLGRAFLPDLVVSGANTIVEGAEDTVETAEELRRWGLIRPIPSTTLLTFVEPFMHDRASEAVDELFTTRERQLCGEAMRLWCEQNWTDLSDVEATAIALWFVRDSDDPNTLPRASADLVLTGLVASAHDAAVDGDKEKSAMWIERAEDFAQILGDQVALLEVMANGLRYGVYTEPGNLNKTLDRLENSLAGESKTSEGLSPAYVRSRVLRIYALAPDTPKKAVDLGKSLCDSLKNEAPDFRHLDALAVLAYALQHTGLMRDAAQLTRYGSRLARSLGDTAAELQFRLKTFELLALPGGRIADRPTLKGMMRLASATMRLAQATLLPPDPIRVEARLHLMVALVSAALTDEEAREAFSSAFLSLPMSNLAILDQVYLALLMVAVLTPPRRAPRIAESAVQAADEVLGGSHEISLYARFMQIGIRKNSGTLQGSRLLDEFRSLAEEAQVSLPTDDPVLWTIRESWVDETVRAALDRRDSGERGEALELIEKGFAMAAEYFGKSDVRSVKIQMLRSEFLMDKFQGHTP